MLDKVVLGMLLVGVAMCGKWQAAVVEVGDNTLHDLIEEEPHVLIAFYAPWCGYCKKFMPEFEKAAKKLAGENVVLAAVDVTLEERSAGEFRISSLPTIKWFRNGSFVHDYIGAREANGVIDYVEKKLGPSFYSFDELEDHQEYIEMELASTLTFAQTDDIAVMAYFKDPIENNPVFDAWYENTLILKDGEIQGLVTDVELTEMIFPEQNTDRNFLAIYRSFGKTVILELTEGINSSTIVDFIVRWGLPSFRDVQSSLERLNARDVPVGIFFMDFWAADELRAWMEPYADQVFEQIGFGYAGKEYMEHFIKMGGDPDEWPSLIIYDKEDYNYVFDHETYEDLSAENVKAFVKDFFDGKIEGVKYASDEQVDEISNLDEIIKPALHEEL